MNNFFAPIVSKFMPGVATSQQRYSSGRWPGSGLARATLWQIASACALAGVLGGCATAPNFAQHTPEEIIQAHAATKAELAAELPAKEANTERTDETENLPGNELSEEIFYKLLTSEIAFQRGNWEAAYVTILGVAQQTRDPRLARRATEIALSVRRPNEALSAIRLWRELAPDSIEATQYYLGFMAISNNLPEIQAVYVERLKKAEPQQYGALMLQAQRLLARGRDRQQGFTTLEHLLAPYLDTPEAHLALAQGAISNNDNTRALQEAHWVLQHKPDSQLAILTVAQASDKAEAAKALAQFMSNNPQAHDVRLAYASILIDNKQLEEARQQFEQLLKDKPNDATAMYTLGALAMEARHFDLANNYFTRYLHAIETDTNQERNPTAALLNLSQIALERNDHPAALEWLAKVPEQDGKNNAWLGVQFRRAQILAADKKLDEARALLHGIETDSANEQVQIIQTEIQLLRNAKQTDEAIAVVRKGLQSHTDHPDLLYDYALLAESQQNIDEMEHALKRVIALAPNSPHAYNALGYSLADRNLRLDEALSLIEKALSLAPNDPFILDSFGWVHFKLGHYAEAEKALRQAFALRADAEISIHLGEVLWTAGRQDEARALWRDVKHKDPENPSLQQTLARLNARL